MSVPFVHDGPDDGHTYVPAGLVLSSNHVQLSDSRATVSAVWTGSYVMFNGVRVDEPDHLDAFGEALIELAGRLRDSHR